MKIAITSQNFRTITPHAGRTRRFLVYEADLEHEPVEVRRLDLPKELSMREFHGEGTHPLDGIDVVIAGSLGEGFTRRMAARGITAVTTEKTDPIEAVKEYLEWQRSGAAAPASACCGGGHSHAHTHAHSHSHAHGHRHGHASEAAGLHRGYHNPWAEAAGGGEGQ
jgi:predicted Fe-Mo cluster-binding NifX family protein